MNSYLFWRLIPFCIGFAFRISPITAADSAQSPTLLYQQDLAENMTKTLLLELAKNPKELDKQTVKLRVKVNAQGILNDIEVVSSSSNQFVEQTCRRFLQALKLPPIPAAVKQELGQDSVDVETEINIESH